ncbi:protein kinase domain-containing protein, partial [Kribbia dieselivorans]|uniref:protein kinase domain-containing protein n=1 Tax=Kribbia dieselivorans TaxID=331526 RepID=UPI0012ED9FB4
MTENTPSQLLGGRYEVGELIGRGGMAEVHLGYDIRLGRQVAIKILRSDHARDASFLHRFRREAQAVAGLNHPNIVAVYDSGEEVFTESGGGDLEIPYIVMEYVDGQTLRQVLNADGPLVSSRALTILEGVLSALEYSHRMGIVHRDIKPGNVMINGAGEVKVMDFGIARAVADTQATMTQTQSVIGTAQYISPEQAEGQTVDHRSDVYSSGCLLFELLTGRTPFVGDPISLTYQHVRKEPPAPSEFADGISPELDAIVLHALTKDRDARYATAEDFRADCERVRTGLPISAGA